jgi:glutaredoxin
METNIIYPVPTLSDINTDTNTNKKTFTIYSISSCNYCIKAKELLNKENLTIINCDEYKQTNRDNFLNFMDNLTQTTYRTFPMIFHENRFIGGFNRIKIYYENLCSINELKELDDF